MKKVHILQPVDSNYIRLFRWLGYEYVDIMGKPDLICFTGGADVDPECYGHKRHPTTYSSPSRDQHEKDVYELYKGLVPMVGICRGGQFLNVMNGGTMYQDVSGHGRVAGHMMEILKNNRHIVVSSTHHQMMNPGPDHVLLGVGHEGGTRTFYVPKSHEKGEGDFFRTEKSEQDIEVVLYPKTKSLCFQPHPEYEHEDFMDMRLYFRELVEELVK